MIVYGYFFLCEVRLFLTFDFYIFALCGYDLFQASGILKQNEVNSKSSTKMESPIPIPMTEYSDLDQVGTCSIPSPPEWPPLLQVPAPQYRAVRSDHLLYLEICLMIPAQVQVPALQLYLLLEITNPLERVC